MILKINEIKMFGCLKIRKNSGPSTLPYGTPIFKGSNGDRTLLYLTVCALLEKFFAISDNVLLSKPLWKSFSSNKFESTRKNAFLKSMKSKSAVNF